MKTVTYPNSKTYVGVGVRASPRADIVLVGSTRFPIGSVLVDTGADYLQVPASAATTAGLVLGAPMHIRTAGGVITMPLVRAANVEIEGILITTDLLCHPSGTSTPLLGRAALLQLVEVGFDRSQWWWL